MAFDTTNVTFPQLFQAAGYHTFMSGKWHLGSAEEHGPKHYGFEHSHGSYAGAVGMYDHRYREGPFGETWLRDHALIEDSSTTDNSGSGIRVARAGLLRRIRTISFPYWPRFYILS